MQGGGIERESGERESRGLRQALWAWLAAFGSLLLLASCQPAEPPQPRAQAGILDMTAWDFAAQGTFALAGEWGQHLPGQGRATLSLTLLMPEQALPLALALPDIHSAYRLFANGRLLAAAGRLGDDAAGERAVFARKVVPLPAAQIIDLTMEISNYHHFEGGIGHAIRLGPAEPLTRAASLRQAVDVAAFGAMLVLALMLVAFFIGGRRDPDFLAFAAFTAVLAVRTFAGGQLYLLFGEDFRAELWFLLPTFITLFVLPGVYLAFLRRLYPDEVPGRLADALLALSFAMAVLAVLTPPTFYTRLRDPYQIVVLAVPCLASLWLLQAVRRRRPGSSWLLLGNVVFLATLANDALNDRSAIDSTDLSPLGFVVFALCYAAVLALRMVRNERVLAKRLVLMNRQLESKVVERTASLMRAKAAAEAASQSKSEFLAVVSHEIRTPLHGWSGLIELLEDSRLDERQRHYVGLLRHNAAHLTRLIGDILDFARIDAGHMELDAVPFRPALLLEELAPVGEARAAERGLHFGIDIGASVPAAVIGDPRALRRILFHFLDNAFKFTNKGFVQASLDVCAGGLRFAIADSGCGIPLHRRTDVFQSFTQLDGSSRRLHDGSGLGLAICHRLTKAMGGNVGVDPRPGGGSIFWCEVDLPLSKDVPSSTGLDGGHDDSPVPNGARILFADDVELNRLVFRDFLDGTGCTIDEAVDGRQAIALATAPGADYDVAVLDLRMPGTDGFQAARGIRAHEEELGSGRLPVIALTAGSSIEDRRQARDAGFDAFLAKPIARQALLAAIARLLPQERATRPTPPPRPSIEMPQVPAELLHLMPAFLAEMDKDEPVLLRLAEDGDRQALAEFAHAMRGKCAMFGEMRLFDLLGQIESEAATIADESLGEVVVKVVERIGQVRSLGKA
jgi:signal transduction histidine kinase/CheY-like chemotaxis protein